MSYPLNVTNSSCKEHKDCTITTFDNSKGVIGVRHLHQWLDKVGLDVNDGRRPDQLVHGAINVGLLLSYDEETGDAVFDSNAMALVAARLEEGADPAAVLNIDYPIADDHRGNKDKTGNYPKLKRPV